MILSILSEIPVQLIIHPTQEVQSLSVVQVHVVVHDQDVVQVQDFGFVQQVLS
jgi:hypothetical protein